MNDDLSPWRDRTASGSRSGTTASWGYWCSSAQDHLLVQNVAVAPEAQGLGVGRLLLQVAEEQAHVLGLAELRLYTNEAMDENLDYYPRRGYQETHRTRQDGYDRVFFSKWLTD